MGDFRMSTDQAAQSFTDEFGNQFEWIEDGPYPLGRFSTLRDEYLYNMAVDGWANESDGSTEAPTGYFYRISNEPDDIREIARVFGNPVDGIIGHFLLIEDSNGFVSVGTYADAQTLEEDFKALTDEYSAWLDAEDEPHPLIGETPEDD
jgi:hypothetical protein